MATSNQKPVYRNGPPRYQLMAMISHMGQSTLCGHYVAHILKQIRSDTVITETSSAPINNEPKLGLTPPGIAATPDCIEGSSLSGSSPIHHSNNSHIIINNQYNQLPPSSPLSSTSDNQEYSSVTSQPQPGSYQWIIFNDSKVAISKKPPIQFAYLYFYKRIPSDDNNGGGH